MANIFLVCHILLLFHSPKGSWNKSAKYEKLGKYWPYCTRNRAITNAYWKSLSCIILPLWHSWLKNDLNIITNSEKFQNFKFGSALCKYTETQKSSKIKHVINLHRTWIWAEPKAFTLYIYIIPEFHSSRLTDSKRNCIEMVKKQVLLERACQ